MDDVQNLYMKYYVCTKCLDVSFPTLPVQCVQI